MDLSKHVSKPVNQADVEGADILLAVDTKTRDGLLALFPDQNNKIYLLSELVGERRDIIDPEVVSGKDKQEQIFAELRRIVIEGFPKLLQLLKTAK